MTQYFTSLPSDIDLQTISIHIVSFVSRCRSVANKYYKHIPRDENIFVLPYSQISMTHRKMELSQLHFKVVN